MLRSYLPALVFMGLGVGLGLFFTFANSWLGPRTPRRTTTLRVRGLPSDVRRNFRFGTQS